MKEDTMKEDMKMLSLNEELVRQLKFAGLQCDLGAGGGTAASVRCAFTLDGTVAPRQIPEMEFHFSGFQFLHSKVELLEEARAALGVPIEYALSGTGYVLIRPSLFLGANTAPGEFWSDGGKVHESFRSIANIVRDTLIERLHLGKDNPFLLDVRELDKLDGIYEDCFRKGFYALIPCTAELWQYLFNLKSLELHAATSYHKSLGGEVSSRSGVAWIEKAEIAEAAESAERVENQKLGGDSDESRRLH